MHDGTAADTGNIKVADTPRASDRDLEFVRTLEANGLTHLAAAVAQRLQDMSNRAV
jgi:hypothetical protein